MGEYRFNRELYSKVALIKASYNYSDVAYLHLDADEKYFYVHFEAKDGKQEPSEKDFLNELLAQSVRHEIYRQTKDIRELLLARALATSVISTDESEKETDLQEDTFSEDEILKDWFLNNENTETEH